MRILMLHNFYRHRGGEGVSFAVEAEALRELGHEVDAISLDNTVDLPKLNAFQLVCNTVWSRSSYRRVRDLLSQKQYDVLHVQNSFPLWSPSVYDAARDAGVPVVQALRNYRLFCMQTGLFRDGSICEKCSGGRHSWSGIRHRCYRNSLGGSLTVSAMIELHRLRRTWHERVDAFIAVSSCVKGKYVASGWDPGQIRVKHNSVSPVPAEGSGDGGYFVVAGRLSEDKGLLLLLSAWKLLSDKCSAEEIPTLIIIGDGPLEDTLRNEIALNDLASHVQMVGRRSLTETYDMIGCAVATVVPSVRYEPCSRTIAESFAKGTPVIAARIGGAEELVDDGVNGFHFPAGDAETLAEAVMKLWQNPVLASAMRRCAREKFDSDFAPLVNARQLEEIYRGVVAKRGNA